MSGFKCPECGRGFESEQSLVQHSNAKHAQGAPQKVPAKPLRVSRKAIIAVVAILAVAGLAYYIYAVSGVVPQGLGAVGSQHVHSDVKIYLDGRAVDLSQPMYQLRSQYVHVEGGDGDVIHVHATGVTLGYFLRTIGFRLQGNCIEDSLGATLCDSNSSQLKVFVNGSEKKGAENYAFQDLDKVLVRYGPSEGGEIAAELESITDKARLQPRA